MYYACVRYKQDQQRAVLPVSLIKDFNPKNVEDFGRQTEVQAYWVSENGESENFYPAIVTALSESLQGLSKSLRSSRSAVPRIIMAKLNKTAAAPQSLSDKEKKSRKRQATRKELGSIIKAFKGCDGAEVLPEPPSQGGGECSVELEEMKRELQKKNAEIERLNQKVESLEGKLKEQLEIVSKLKDEISDAQTRNTRLCDALLEKIDIARGAAVAPNPAEHQVLAQFVPEHVTPGMELSCYEVLADGPSEGENAAVNMAGRHISLPVENGSCQDSGKTEEEALPLFAVLNGEVHLGSGLMIKETKLLYITASRQEMRVARDLARHYWTTAQMELRSISGAPWRNKGGSALKRLQATPEKVDAIMNVVQNMVNDHPTDVPATKRVANGRKALRDLFAETGRQARGKVPEKTPAAEKTATEDPIADADMSQ